MNKTTPEQIEAVKRYEEAREAARIAGRAQVEAWNHCTAVGLEHVGSYPTYKWDITQGEWRPMAGKPISSSE